MTATKRFIIVYAFMQLSWVLQNIVTSEQNVRLANFLSTVANPEEGRLEILYAKEWRSVCDKTFTNVSAGVACRGLGFGNIGVFIGNRHGGGTGRIWVSKVNCTGTEFSIDKCAHHLWGGNDCNHNEDVSIRCGDTEDYAVRLVNSRDSSKNPVEGRLEIYYAGVWGTVCDDGFKTDGARVVCASLGYGYAGSYISNGFYGAGTGQIWLDEVICTGREQSIDKCNHRPWGAHDCDHNEDVSVRCANTTNFAVRLANSLSHISNPKEGRLEIYYSGSWGTVCGNYSFTDANARVACASLGSRHIGTFIGGRHGSGTGQIWLSGVECDGTEHSIDKCIHSPWGVDNCTHEEDVSISCGITSRLINSLYKANDPEEGRLEIYYAGVWGTVCSDYFTDANARVACASLGLGYNGIFIGNRHGGGTGHIWFGIFSCNGTEDSIDMCSRSSFGVHYCDHIQDVSLRCGATSDFAVRLINTFGNKSNEGRSGNYNSNEGRLEIYYSGIWGTVCSKDFTDTSARVACASLGYGFVGAVIEKRFGGGTDVVWLDDVKCKGTENSIAQCSHRMWGEHSCDYDDVLSISCAFVADQNPDTKVIAIATLAILLGLGILLAATFIYRNAYKTRQERDYVVPEIHMRTTEPSGRLDKNETEIRTGETGYAVLQSSCVSDKDMNADDYQTINDYSEIPCLELQSESTKVDDEIDQADSN